MKQTALVRLAAEPDPGVHRIVADLGKTLGHFIATACVFLNPEAVIVDGFLGAAAKPSIEGLHQGIDQEAPTAIVHGLRVVPGDLAERAELLGCAALGQTSLRRPAP
jgi:predicted NBD/HSP70 family sugar kinase